MLRFYCTVLLCAEVLLCRGKVFYMTTKDVRPGQELFVYYGDGYAQTLGIDVDRYQDDDYYAEALNLNGITCQLNQSE